MTFFGKNFLSDWWFLVSSLLYLIHKFSRTFKIHQMVLLSIRVDAKKWIFSCFEITFYLMVKRKIRFDRNWRCHRPFPYSELFWSEFFFFFPHLDWIRRDTEYLPVFSPNAEKCRKNADQNNSEYEHFLHSPFSFINLENMLNRIALHIILWKVHRKSFLFQKSTLNTFFNLIFS